MIAAVARPDSGYVFVDLTAELTPWGELPYGPQGEFAIVVRSDLKGQGLGRVLLEKMIRYCRERGVARVVVHDDPFPVNARRP